MRAMPKTKGEEDGSITIGSAFQGGVYSEKGAQEKNIMQCKKRREVKTEGKGGKGKRVMARRTRNIWG